MTSMDAVQPGEKACMFIPGRNVAEFQPNEIGVTMLLKQTHAPVNRGPRGRYCPVLLLQLRFQRRGHAIAYLARESIDCCFEPQRKNHVWRQRKLRTLRSRGRYIGLRLFVE